MAKQPTTPVSEAKKPTAKKANTKKAPEVITPEIEITEKFTDEVANNQIIKLNIADASIDNMIARAEGLILSSLEDKETFQTIKALYGEFVTARTTLDKKRKEIYKPFQEIVDRINSEAKRLTDRMSNTEKALKAQLENWKQWETEAEEKAKKEAEAELKKRVQDLQEAGLVFNGSYYACGDITLDIATIENLSPADLIVLTKKVTDAKAKLDQEAQAKAEQEEAERKEREEAQQKIDQENARLEKEKADLLAEKLEARSMIFEALGVESDHATFFYKCESGSTSLEKSKIAEMDKATFDNCLAGFKSRISDLKKADEDLAKKREQEAKEKAEADAKKAILDARVSRIETMGFKRVCNDLEGHGLRYSISYLEQKDNEQFEDFCKDLAHDLAEIKKREAEKAEKDRQASLSDAQKLQEYMEAIEAVKIPELSTEAGSEILADFKNDLKLAFNKLKNLIGNE